MNKLAALCLAVILFAVCGCQTCVPCKFNADKDKAKIDSQNAIGDINPAPQVPDAAR